MDRPEEGAGAAPYALSMVVHGLVAVVAVYTLTHAPLVRDPWLNDRYAVRQVELRLREPVAARTPKIGKEQAGDGADVKSQPAGGTEPWELPQFEAALQTLVQPDLPPNLKLKEKIPVPAVAIWTPKKKLLKEIVLPRPQPPSAAKARPSLVEPNEELTLSDVGLTATDAQVPFHALLPGTTTPVKVEGQELLQMAPSMPSESTKEPTPAAALSLSDVRMKKGTATLPPANQTRPDLIEKTRAQGLVESNSGIDGGPEQDGSSGKAATAAKSKGSGAADAARQNGALGAAETDHLTFPKDGRFGVVVVGSSLEDEYPELLRIWGGRMAYTVYLRVGQTRNWILQYSLPEADARATDGAAALDAPWPYDVVRPHLIPALLDADAMVLHGIVNRQGRFERLSLVYPPQTPQATLVLQSLAQWRFRPAMQNGALAAVEVVLVIPNETE